MAHLKKSKRMQKPSFKLGTPPPLSNSLAKNTIHTRTQNLLKLPEVSNQMVKPIRRTSKFFNKTPLNINIRRKSVSRVNQTVQETKDVDFNEAHPYAYLPNQRDCNMSIKSSLSKKDLRLRIQNIRKHSHSGSRKNTIAEECDYLAKEHLSVQNKVNIKDCKRTRSVMRKYDNATSKLHSNLTLDTQLKGMVRVVSDTELKVKDVSFKYICTFPQEQIRAKLKSRLEDLKGIKPAHENINLPSKFDSFLYGASQWLRDAISQEEELQEARFTEVFKLTDSGDIYIGKLDSDTLTGKGICITYKNEVIEGKFKDGKVILGRARILYSNGEYYEGMIKHDGIKDGKGIYYYENGDIYDGEFVDNKRVLSMANHI